MADLELLIEQLKSELHEIYGGQGAGKAKQIAKACGITQGVKYEQPLDVVWAEIVDEADRQQDGSLLCLAERAHKDYPSRPELLALIKALKGHPTAAGPAQEAPALRAALWCWGAALTMVVVAVLADDPTLRTGVALVGGFFFGAGGLLLLLPRGPDATTQPQPPQSTDVASLLKEPHVQFIVLLDTKERSQKVVSQAIDEPHDFVVRSCARLLELLGSTPQRN